MTKHFGLKKLRKIAGSDPRWEVAPFKTYHDAKEFRMPHFKGNPRLLLRGDEKGKRYSKLSYPEMHRAETNSWLSGHTFASDEERVRCMIDSVKNHAGQGKHTVVIAHPTKPRGEMLLTGQVSIGPRPDAPLPEISLRIAENPGWATIPNHRDIVQEIVKWKYKKGKIVANRKLDALAAIIKNRRHFETIRAVREFLAKGIKDGQIKPNRQRTQIAFIVWKNAPGKLEFYDLIEERAKQRE
jgi:hypothetical protein